MRLVIIPTRIPSRAGGFEHIRFSGLASSWRLRLTWFKRFWNSSFSWREFIYILHFYAYQGKGLRRSTD